VEGKSVTDCLKTCIDGSPYYSIIPFNRLQSQKVRFKSNQKAGRTCITARPLGRLLWLLCRRLNIIGGQNRLSSHENIVVPRFV
jgi:hypothetical protein